MRLAVFFLVLVLASGCIRSVHTPLEAASVSIHNNTFEVEIADTLPEQRKGLMFRESLEADKGMLFVYRYEEPRSFWMKNTMIPLDVLFISSNYTVVDMKEMFEPCRTVVCPVYTSKPAQFVLEIHGGLSERMGIKIGDIVTLPLLWAQE